MNIILPIQWWISQYSRPEAEYTNNKVCNAALLNAACNPKSCSDFWFSKKLYLAL